MTQADRGGPQRGRVMPVVDIEETYSTGHRMFLTGWKVTSWDGDHETTRHVPVQKGYPADTIDEDWRADWVHHHKDVCEASKWAMTIWSLARKTDWPWEIGEVVASEGRIEDRSFTTFSMICGGGFSFIGALEKRFPEARRSDYIVSTYLPPPTFAKKLRTAILAESKDEFLWELVFAWPEAEWEARWSMFVDALREERWGSEWARVGECLAVTDWKPPCKMGDLMRHEYLPPLVIPGPFFFSDAHH